MSLKILVPLISIPVIILGLITQPKSQTNNTSPISNTPPNNFILGDRNYIPKIINSNLLPPKPDDPETNRLKEMVRLLNSPGNNYSEYRKLCNLATHEPQIGMTFAQSRATTWCIPYSRNKTITAQGEFVQEVYLKNPNAPANISARKYLYFQNGILVSIQE